MSLRDEVLPIPSVEQLRQRIISGDTSLLHRARAAAKEELQNDFGDVDELGDEEREEFDDELAQRTAKLDTFFSSEPHPEIEDGELLGTIESVIFDTKLYTELPIPFNKTYKHTSCWPPYIKQVSGQVSEVAIALLTYLNVGRPLRGQRLESDWGFYSWLSTSEMRQLHEELSQVSIDGDLDEFHDDLIVSLRMLLDNGSEMFLACS